MYRSIPLLLLMTALLFSPCLHAQSVQPTLTYNGHANASVPVDSVLTIEAHGTPMVPFVIALNMNPGPMVVNGLTIPLAMDAGLLVTHSGSLLDGTGTFIDTLVIPNQPLLEGLTLHGALLTVDAGFPGFLGVSNAASFTFARGANAGMDTAGLINSEIPLDGGGITTASPLPSGHSASWAVVNGPAGHAATLEGAGSLFPTLKADLPGTYDVEVSVLAAGTTVGPTDIVQVSVYDLDITSHAQGTFTTADPVNIAATLSGPPANSFGVLSGTAGAGGSLNHQTAAGAVFTGVPMQVVSGTGQKVGTGLTLINNVGSPLSQDPVDGLTAYAGQVFLDAMETGIETAFAQINLSGPLPAMPAIPVANVPGFLGTTMFSANVTPLSFTYDPNVSIDLTATTTGLNVLLTLNNVSFVFDVNGLVFNSAYTDQGTMSMTSVDISMDIVSTANNGVVTSTVNNETATFHGAALTFSNGSLIGSFSSLLFGAIVPVTEGLVATTVATAIPPLMDQIFTLIPQSFDLAPSGIDVTLNIPITGFDYYATGLGIRLGAGAQANGPPTGSSMQQGYFVSGGAAPSYTGVSPVAATPYSGALSISQDVANQALAVAVEAGSLDLTFRDPLDLAGTILLPVAGAYAMLFPGIGFEKFDPTAAVSIALRPTVSPVATIGLSTGDLAGLSLSDFIMDLRVQPDPADPYTVSIISMAMSGDVGLNATYDPVLLTLDLFLGSVAMTGYVRHSMPGVDASPLVMALTGILGMVLPTFTTPIASIPVALPTIPGLTLPPLGLAGIEADGAGGDYLSIFLL